MTTPSKELGLLAIVEVTNACNLRCGYCYLGPLKSGDMSLDVAKRVVSEFIKHNQSQGKLSKFYWHGGEPTLRGVSFFHTILRFTEELSSDGVIHAIQSNGVNIDEEWIAFLENNDMGLGISLDGFDESHDLGRPFANGTPSNQKVLRTLDRLASTKIPLGVLFTLHTKNRHEVEKVFRFCRERGFEFGMNALTRTPYRQAFEENTPTPEMFADAVIELFDLWISQRNGERRIKANPPVGLVRAILTQSGGGECSHCLNCNEVIMAVRPNGDIYPCNRFSGLDGFRFGNIVTDGLEACLQHPSRQEILSRRYNRIETCRLCNLAKLCNAGCMGQAHGEFGTIFREDPMCRAYQRMFNYVLKTIQINLTSKKEIQNEGRET
jgi:uncharacterized protein